MKINNRNVELKLLEEDYIEGEMVAYDEDSRRIIAFNKTASFIWSILLKTFRNKGQITTKEICEKVMKEFEISYLKEQEIVSDVNDIICQFEEQKLILECED